MLRELELQVPKVSSYLDIARNKLRLHWHFLTWSAWLNADPSSDKKWGKLTFKQAWLVGRAATQFRTEVSSWTDIMGQLTTSIWLHEPRGSLPPLFRTDLNLPGRSPYECEFQQMYRENSLWMFSRTWADLFEPIRNRGYNCWFFSVESWRQRWLILN